MKIAALIVGLIASLVLNSALVKLLVAGAAASSRPTPVAVPAIVRPAVSALKIEGDVWPGLQPDDLPALVTRLRATGFPPSIVRAIISAQLTASSAARRKALDPEADKRPFWKNLVLDVKLQIAFRQLDREQQKMLRTLLGDDAEPDDPVSRAAQRRRLGDLPPEQAAPVKRIREYYDDLRFELINQTVGGLDVRAKIAGLEKEQHDAIAKILGPAELEQFDLRASNTADSLRSRLAAFDPTEQEFRTLFQLQRAFNDQFASLSHPPTQEETRQRNEAQQQLKEQTKAALGLERYADYERSIDSNYQQTSRLVARLELPAEAANQVWSVQKDIQQRAAALRGDLTLSDQQRIAQLAALATEASAKVGATLGPGGLEVYKDNGGWWIVDLTVARPGR